MFLVERADSRYELRESHATERGPRSRTLVSFRVLDDQVLARARVRATHPFDVAELVESARAKGIPIRLGERAESLARELLGELRRGETVPAALAALLGEALAGPDLSDVPDTVPPMAAWVGASPAERAEALGDLLGLSDAIGHRREGPLTFPRLEVA